MAVRVHFANSEIFERDESQLSAANATWNRSLSAFGVLQSPATEHTAQRGDAAAALP